MKQNFFRKSMVGLTGLLCFFGGNVQAASCCLPCLPSCWELIIGGEFLYWTVNQANLDFAVDVSDRCCSDKVVGPGDVHFLEPQWSGGGRGWLGIEGECWDLRAVYTYYKNNSSHSVSGTEDDLTLWATLVHPATVRSEALFASASNHLTYQTIDLLLGTEFSFCCEKARIHPFFGARGLKLQQKFKTYFEGEEFVNCNGIDRPAQVNFNSDLKGVGIHAGMDFGYDLVKGFGLYGCFAGSLLAGETNNHQTQWELDENGFVHEVLVDINEKEKMVIPGLNLCVGLNWASCFDYGKHMLFTVSYEFNEWFNTPELRRFSDFISPGVSHSNRGNIGIHGVNVSLTLFF